MARGSSSKIARSDGTIAWPIVPGNPDTVKLLTTRLHGYTTSDKWLPEGIHSELDELCGRHLRLRERCLAEIERVQSLQAKFRSDGTRRSAVVDEADGLGLPEPAEDNRTPHGERATQLDDAH